MKLQRNKKSRRILCAAACVALAGAALCVIAWIALPFPAHELAVYPAALQLLDASGSPLRTVLGAQDVCCYPVPLDDMGVWTWKALVAAEDKRFFRHHGIDPLAICRAALLNLRRGRVVSGASTIPTQVIRLMHPRRRTLPAKCIEAFRALQLECLLEKRGILEQHLNRAPFGANVIGIEAASRRYFSKHSRDLTLAESALLIGLLTSPSANRPDRHFDRACSRMRYVLDRMEAAGYIAPGEKQAAFNQHLAVVPAATPFAAPHFCDCIIADRGTALWHGRDSNACIRTTLDPRVQAAAASALARHAASMRAQGVEGGAVVVLDVRSASVIAMAGSPDYFDAERAGQVNAAVALRSPGSALKPFAYALAIDRGMLTPGTVLADVPVHFPDYVPRNIDGEFCGLVTARDALVRSLNIPALGVALQTGIEPLAAALRDFGLATIAKPATQYGLSMVLGTVEVRLLDVANAYACLARGGSWLPCRMLGNDPLPAPRRVISPEAAWLVADILSDSDRVRAYAGISDDDHKPRVALKTGTSSARRDAWAVLFNPQYVVAVWIGNPDGRSSASLAGIHAAAPLAYDVFRRTIPEGSAPWFDQPAGIHVRRVCAVSGKPAGPLCPATAEDYAISGVTDPAQCTVHRLQPCDAGSGDPVALADANRTGVTWKVAEVWPAPVAAFLHASAAPAERQTRPGLRIVSPNPGTTYCRIRGDSQCDVITLAARGGEGGRFWFVDNVYLGQDAADGQRAWRLEKGRHVIACADGSGQAASATILVE